MSAPPSGFPEFPPPPPKCNFDIVRTIVTAGFGSIAYGLHIAVASMTLFWVLKETRTKSTKLHCLFVVTLIISGSINYFFSVANYLYETKTAGDTLSFNMIPNVAALFIAFLCNCLLLYRLYAVWDGKKWILIAPTTILIAALVYGSLRVSTIGNIESQIHTMLYWVTTFVLNVVLTCLISGRIMWMRKKLRLLLGEKFSQSYGSNLSIIVESSVLYTVVSLLGAIPVFSIRHERQLLDYAFGPLLVQSECVASELIILRLVMTRAVSRQYSTTARSADPERSAVESTFTQQ